MKNILYAFVILTSGFVFFSCTAANDPPMYEVKIETTPPDAGRIIPSSDSVYEAETKLTLEAIPDSAYLFNRWIKEDTIQANPYTFTVHKDENLTAYFQIKSYELSVTTEGEGTVREEVVQARSKDYEHGTVVELTAEPSTGYQFVEWRGDIFSVENPTRIKVDKAKQVTAVFQKKKFAMTVSVTGEGTIEKSPNQSEYPYGTTVELSAVPGTGYEFVEWTGDLISSNNPEQVTVDNAKNITAVFEQTQTYPEGVRIAFEGMSGSGMQHPPDLDLAVGPDRVIAVSNVDIVIYSKSGNKIDSIKLYKLNSLKIEGLGSADPRVVYDKESERFFLTAMSHNKPCNKEAGECIAYFDLAVSKTSSPDSFTSSDWHIYSFPSATEGTQPSYMFPDFPRIGVTKNAVVLVGEMVDLNPEFEYDGAFTRLRILEKSKLLNGEEVGWTDVDNIRDGEKTGAMLQPVKVSSNSQNLLFVSMTLPNCGLELWALTNPLQDPEVDRVEVAGSAMSSNMNCRNKIHATQKGSAPRLETGGRDPMSSQAVRHNGSLWVSHVVEVSTGSGKFLGVRWTEISVNGWPGTPHAVQNTVLYEEGSHAFYPAITVTPLGDPIIVYSQSSKNEYPSVYYRTQNNTISSGKLLRKGLASLTSGTQTLNGEIRFGDYLGATVDPANNSFWIIGEYAKDENNWGSIIANVEY